ncbi:hypothetical protein AAHC03_05392 [Spirometra sp. Aus1]
MDIGKKFVSACKVDSSKSEAIVAIELLINLIKRSDVLTVQGLDDLINDAVKQMRETDKSNSSVKSACELFQRFITLAVLDTVGDFEGCKRVILERADVFLRKISRCRQQISANALLLFADNARLLINSYSRVVVEALVHFVKSSMNRRQLHCYVTECMPSSSGVHMVGELMKSGVSCTLVPDTAVAYLMPQIDAVVVGAEAVVESGGCLNALGSCTMCMIAHSLGKPVYVMVESFKFLRVYPLDQRHIADELKWRASKLKEIRSKTMLDEVKPTEDEDDVFEEMNDVWHKVEKQKVSVVDKDIPSVDYTNPLYITALVTDLGILTPSAVSDELIKLYL